MLESRVSALSVLAESSGGWMVWNTFLAWIPVLLGFYVFTVPVLAAHDMRRTPAWWAGLVLFVLFLPNAPYVVTDLVHLRADVHRLGPDGPVATTVLPVYGLLILSGLVAYAISLMQLGWYLDRFGLGRFRPAAFLGLHALVAVGIFLGRWSRLNSWEPVVEPRGTLERVLMALTWSAAPVLIVTLFVVTALGHFVTRAVLEALWGSVQRARLRPVR